MALNYQPPQRRQEDTSGLVNSLDNLFNAYQRGKMQGQQFGIQQQVQGLQLQNAQRERTLGQIQDVSQFGAPLDQFTPEQIQAANRPAPGNMSELPEITKLREGFARLKAWREQQQKLSDTDLRLKESNIAENEAQAAKLMAEAGRGGLSLKDQQKQAQDLQELQVPGYAMGKDVRPLPAEAKDLRTGVAALKDFTRGVDRMKELIKQHGSTNMVGEGSGEMQTLAANLKLTLKEVQKLGVLSSSDIAFLDAQVFDPSRVSSLFTRTGTALKQLDTIKGRAESALNESLKSRGFSPSGGGGDSVRVQLPDGRVGNIPAANLQSALSRGAKRL